MELTVRTDRAAGTARRRQTDGSHAREETAEWECAVPVAAEAVPDSSVAVVAAGAEDSVAPRERAAAVVVPPLPSIYMSRFP
jgi:hypothetical protein